MLPTDLLISRQNGETIIPKRLPIAPDYLMSAQEQITCFQESIGETVDFLSECFAPTGLHFTFIQPALSKSNLSFCLCSLCLCVYP